MLMSFQWGCRALIWTKCHKQVVSAAIFSIVPSHIMRSVAGGYDNESIAMFAMCLTFYLWILSLRNDYTVGIGALTAISYIYMVAAWGGYVFVLNMIGVHAAFLIILNLVTRQYSSKLHRAYSLFYIIGTVGAIQFPVVGYANVRVWQFE
jgi:dolichyl-diphosphooligosaccharide--protein glycosyltransferase